MALFGSKEARPTALGISLEQATAVIEAARQHAEKIGVQMNIAVVDAGNNLIAFARMDGAWLGSIDIAQGKAYTARAFDMETKALGRASQPGRDKTAPSPRRSACPRSGSPSRPRAACGSRRTSTPARRGRRGPG